MEKNDSEMFETYQELMCHFYIVGYLKIIEDKASDANLTDMEVAFQPQMRASCQMRGLCFNPNADLTSFVKHRGHIPTSDVNLTVSTKRDGHTVL